MLRLRMYTISKPVSDTISDVRRGSTETRGVAPSKDHAYFFLRTLHVEQFTLDVLEGGDRAAFPPL